VLYSIPHVFTNSHNNGGNVNNDGLRLTYFSDHLRKLSQKKGVECSFLKYRIDSFLYYSRTFLILIGLVWFMVLNATFNNIWFISWRSVLLVEETGGTGENNRPVTSH
jgi:hypothetical protein